MTGLTEHFTYKKLLRYTLPTIAMLIFTSVYSVVDGFFVSNFAGKTPFAAVNLIMPVLMIFGCVGFMFGTGGGALIAKTMGEGKKEQANEMFSMIVAASVVVGIVLAVLGEIGMKPIAQLLGAEGELLHNSVLYGRILMLAIPFYILQYAFQCLFATAGKPRLGLIVTVMAGVANIVLDFLFVGVFHWGLVGAAVATAVSQFIGGIVPIVYFSRKNDSLLRFVRFSLNWDVLGKTCTNGSSELMSNISMSIVGMLYNGQLMKYAGEDGIAAYGVLMYVSMIFQAIFIGYAVGSSPVVSWHYGAGNHGELKSLLKKSCVLTGTFAVVMFAAGELLGRPLAQFFVGYDAELLDMTAHAFAIFSGSFLLSGFSIYGSSFFTALNDGLTSALISFLRTLVFQVSAVLLLPLIWGLDGVWYSILVAEAASVLVTAGFLFGKRKRYRY